MALLREPVAARGTRRLPRRGTGVLRGLLRHLLGGRGRRGSGRCRRRRGSGRRPGPLRGAGRRRRGALRGREGGGQRWQPALLRPGSLLTPRRRCVLGGGRRRRGRVARTLLRRGGRRGGRPGRLHRRPILRAALRRGLRSGGRGLRGGRTPGLRLGVAPGDLLLERGRGEAHRVAALQVCGARPALRRGRSGLLLRRGRRLFSTRGHAGQAAAVASLIDPRVRRRDQARCGRVRPVRREAAVERGALLPPRGVTVLRRGGGGAVGRGLAGIARTGSGTRGGTRVDARVTAGARTAPCVAGRSGRTGAVGLRHTGPLRRAARLPAGLVQPEPAGRAVVTAGTGSGIPAARVGGGSGRRRGEGPGERHRTPGARPGSGRRGRRRRQPGLGERGRRCRLPLTVHHRRRVGGGVRGGGRHPVRAGRPVHVLGRVRPGLRRLPLLLVLTVLAVQLRLALRHQLVQDSPSPALPSRRLVTRAVGRGRLRVVGH
ncbi:hypothetical protein SDIAM26S_00355 [Streptomyces diastaticus subsp. diastaticus]